MRIYLDMCCYNRPYDDQSQLTVSIESQTKLFVQELIKNGKVDLIGSYVLDYELSRNPFEMRRRAIDLFIKEYMKGYVGFERDVVIAPLANEIMQTGIKEKDAFHLAAAIYAECDYFISTDYRLLKYKTNKIKLVTPVTFVMEMEGEQ